MLFENDKGKKYFLDSNLSYCLNKPDGCWKQLEFNLLYNIQRPFSSYALDLEYQAMSLDFLRVFPSCRGGENLENLSLKVILADSGGERSNGEQLTDVFDIVQVWYLICQKPGGGIGESETNDSWWSQHGKKLRVYGVLVVFSCLTSWCCFTYKGYLVAYYVSDKVGWLFFTE